MNLGWGLNHIKVLIGEGISWKMRRRDFILGMFAFPILSGEVYSQDDSLDFGLEGRDSEIEGEPTREDYLDELKKILGEKYEKIMEAETPVMESKKNRWTKYWENASLDQLRVTVRRYDAKLNPITDVERKRLPDMVEQISGFNFYSLMEYYPWMNYGKSGNGLSYREMKILVQGERDFINNREFFHKFRRSD